MSEYFQFFLQNWLLSLGFIIVLILFIINEIWSQKTAAQKVSAQRAVQMMNNENALIIDVRGKTDFKAGHILGAKNILPNDIGNKLSATDKNRPLILVCSNGQNTLKLAQQLKTEGLNTYYLHGGLAAWREDGLPLEH